MIKDNVKNVLERINNAANAQNREIKLVAVTKNRSIDQIQQIVDCGIKDLGENRVQEFLEKYPHFDNVNWHIIGTLQKNKVKYVVGKVALIHSVDSVELAREIDKRSYKEGVVTNVLLQVNIAKEASKHGFEEEALEDAIKSISEMSNINVQGIMMIAPNTENKEYLKELFAKTENIFHEMMKYNVDYGNINIRILSMGMSHDYVLAIEAGSNMVRIGRSLFV